MGVSLQELELKSLELELLLNQLKEDFSVYLKETEYPSGVTKHEKYMIVNSNELLKGGNWSPSYWDSQKQAKLVMKVLDKSITLKEFKSSLNKMIETKKIITGVETVYLNDKILDKLKNALDYEIGVINDKK